MFEKNKEKMKEKMEPDKVLRFAIVAVILLFLIGALIIGTRMMNPRVDATEGVKKLTELEDANVQKIDAKIQAYPLYRKRRCSSQWRDSGCICSELQKLC